MQIADAAGSDRVLVGEVTIVPPPALGRYYERKRQHAGCARRAGAQLLVVAVGTDGALHPESRAQLAMLVGSEARAADFDAACADIAASVRARGASKRATPPAPRDVALTRRGRTRARRGVALQSRVARRRRRAGAASTTSWRSSKTATL